MEIFTAYWIALTIALSLFAAHQGKQWWLWLLLGFFLSPLFALVMLGIILIVESAGEKPDPKTYVRCPDCRSLIRRDASKCKHCGCSMKTD